MSSRNFFQSLWKMKTDSREKMNNQHIIFVMYLLRWSSKLSFSSNRNLQFSRIVEFLTKILSLLLEFSNWPKENIILLFSKKSFVFYKKV